MRFLALLALMPVVWASSRAEYVGGTEVQLAAAGQGAMDLTDQVYFAFYSKKAQVRIRYDRINLLEYGQKVDRRVLEALISPAFLLSKKRKHFLTIGYTDDEGNRQAIVFRIDKNGVRAALVSLEARTGLKIQYQDEEARKAGRG